jgi:hypothetical protein
MSETIFAKIKRLGQSRWPALRSHPTVIHIQDACDYFTHAIKEAEDPIRELLLNVPIRPPYEMTWFEWVNPSGEEMGVMTGSATNYDIGKLAKQFGDRIALLEPRDREELDGMITLKRCVLFEVFARWTIVQTDGSWDESLTWLGTSIAPCDEAWGLSGGFIYLMSKQNRELSAPQIESWTGAMRAIVTRCAFALGLCHTRNCSLDPIQLTRAERRRNLKDGLPDIITRSLVLGPIQRYLALLRSSDGSEATTLRLHRCRGHFKTFTAEHPLMGKHIGRFWWMPHLRGDPDKGLTIQEPITIQSPHTPEIYAPQTL